MLRSRPIARAALVLALGLCLAAPGVRAAEKTIGLSCSSDNSNIDWDTVGQCNGTAFARGPLILGAMTDPPYSSTGCSSSNAGMVQYTGSILEYCNGSNWTALGSVVGGANGTSMITGWPDALVCSVTNPSYGTNVFYANAMPYTNGLYYYRYFTGTGNFDVVFNSDGSFNSYDNMTTTNCNASISSLYGSSQAFNLANAVSQAGYNPTVPSGSGYFVLTKTTYTGNLGGRFAADALCLTDLTTNTGWKGYAAANSNGQLVSANVHAWTCETDTGSCTTFTPLTTYYFANANDSSAGGAYFTSDSSGNGPNDNADWAAANYFNGTYNYWTGFETYNYNTTYPDSHSIWACPEYGNWSSASSSDSGGYGSSNNNNYFRWGGNGSSGQSQYTSCNTSLPMLCFVNP